MTKNKCFQTHKYELKPAGMSEKLSLFQVSLFCQEYICPICGIRKKWMLRKRQKE